MSDYIKKGHNVSVLLYHIMCPSKYGRIVFDDDLVESTLREICIEIQLRYEIKFIEICVDDDHVHFLVQSVPTYRPSDLVSKIKSITARESFRRAPSVRKMYWSGHFWASGYFISTVGFHGTENSIRNYVKNQGTGKN